MKLYNPKSWFEGTATLGEYWLKGVLLSLLFLVPAFVMGLLFGMVVSVLFFHIESLDLGAYSLFLGPVAVFVYMLGMGVRRMRALGFSENGICWNAGFLAIVFVLVLFLLRTPEYAWNDMKSLWLAGSVLVEGGLFLLLGLIPGNKKEVKTSLHAVRRPMLLDEGEPAQTTAFAQAQEKSAGMHEVQKKEGSLGFKEKCLSWAFGSSTRGVYWIELLVALFGLWLFSIAFLLFLSLLGFIVPWVIIWFFFIVLFEVPLFCVIFRRCRGLNLPGTGWLLCILLVVAFPFTQRDGSPFLQWHLFSVLPFLGMIVLGFIPGYERSPGQPHTHEPENRPQGPRQTVDETEDFRDK